MSEHKTNEHNQESGARASPCRALCHSFSPHQQYGLLRADRTAELSNYIGCIIWLISGRICRSMTFLMSPAAPNRTPYIVAWLMKTIVGACFATSWSAGHALVSPAAERGGNYRMYASVYYNPAASIAQQFNLNAHIIREYVFSACLTRVFRLCAALFILIGSNITGLSCTRADFPRIFRPDEKWTLRKKWTVTQSVSRGRIYLSSGEKHLESFGSVCFLCARRFFQFYVLKPDDLVWVVCVHMCLYKAPKDF